MPQCQFPVFSCFWFQKSYTGNILGIGRNLCKVNILPEDSRSQKGSPGGGLGGPHHPQARVTPWPRLGRVWPTWPPPGSALSPIYSLRRENPKYPSQISRKDPQPPSSSTLAREGSEALPGTLPERGIITGGLFITMPASGVMRE